MLLDVTHSLEVRIAGLALTLVLEHRPGRRTRWTLGGCHLWWVREAGQG